MKWKLFLGLLIISIFLAGKNIAIANTTDTSVTVLGADPANVPGTPILTADYATQITATWSANSNQDGTEYYIENITAVTNSGWITVTSWTSSSLTCGTTYSFRVKARNSDLVETSFSSTATASTLACPVSSLPPSSTGGGGYGGRFILPPPNSSGTAENNKTVLEQIQEKIYIIAGQIQNLSSGVFHPAPSPTPTLPPAHTNVSPPVKVNPSSPENMSPPIQIEEPSPSVSVSAMSVCHMGGAWNWIRCNFGKIVYDSIVIVVLMLTIFVLI